MNKELEKQLAVVFEQDYPGYEFFVEHVINRIFTEDDAYEALPVPEDYLTDENRQKANESGILRIDKVGTIETEEPLEVFDVTLSNRKELQYNRVGIQQFIRSSLFPFTNAFMLFHNETPKDKDWRFSFAYKESTIKGMTSAKRYTYLFGKNHRARTASERFAKLADEEKDTQNLLNAFSVETLSKDFFNEYKNQYKGFCNFLFTHKSDSEYFGREFAQWEDKYIRDYVKKMMGRITFIYFLQRKGWMNGDMEYMQNAFMRSSHQDDYLDVFLEPLFFGVLNTKPEERKDLFEQEGWDLSLLNEWKDVPYLNGGLFERDIQDEPKSKFPAEMFKELFEFYSRYNFTIDENDPDDAEVGVDPEMLGHIFENLLEDNKDKGAFYTPKEIVQYMSQESVAQYLKSHVQSDLHEAIDVLVKHREVVSILQKKENAKLVYNTLAKVKVCDPAIGSGAFPMGVLNVLFDSRLRLYPYTGNKKDFSWAKTKREIIQNNIYGVDIEKGAVDIARLRFWLALVVDESEPQPLPNLDYKIMCGDSLLHRFALDAPFKSILRDYNQKNGTQYTLDDYRQWVYDYTDISDHTQKDTFRQKIEDIKHAVKTELSDKEKGKIAKVRGTIANLQMEDMFGGKKKENEKKIKALQKELKALEQQREEIESNKIYEQAFEWRFEFPALLDDDGNFTGFDIVIANPPYIQLQAEKGRLSLLYSNSSYKTFFRTGDIYCLFFELGNILLKNNGTLSFIVPNTWLQSITFDSFRLYLSSFFSWEKFLITEKTFDAVVDTHCVLFKKSFIQTNCEVFKQTGSSISYLHTIGKQFISQTKNCINVEANPKASSIARRIMMENKPMSAFFTIYNGVKPFEKGKGNPAQTADTMREKPFVKKGIQPGKEWLPLLRGSLMNRYVNLWRNDYWILYGEWLAAPRQPEIFNAEEKIIVRQTGDSIIATVIGKNIICRNNLHICISETNIDNKYVLGILNSKLINFIYKFINPEVGEALAEVKKNHVEQLPIAQTDNKQLIADVVTEILKTKEANSLADTQVLEDKIDFLVYQLYGLTYDEVLIVDPETSITREEYEDNCVNNR